MNKNIVVFSGTSDSFEIIKLLVKNGFNVIASVATNEGTKMLSNIDNIKISEERLDNEKMTEFFINSKTNIVVDASHPYAENVSKTAIEVCKSLNIKYIRYERPSEGVNENCIFVDNYEKAVEFVEKINGNILVTTGVNNIEKYMALNNYKNRIFARVLNNEKSYNKAKYIGLSDEHILQGSGIYTTSNNINVINKYNIKSIITKDSGRAGGFLEKTEAAHICNIPIIIIKRPSVQYGIVTDNISGVLDIIREGDIL